MKILPNNYLEINTPPNSIAKTIIINLKNIRSIEYWVGRYDDETKCNLIIDSGYKPTYYQIDPEESPYIYQHLFKITPPYFNITNNNKELNYYKFKTPLNL